MERFADKQEVVTKSNDSSLIPGNASSSWKVSAIESNTDEHLRHNRSSNCVLSRQRQRCLPSNVTRQSDVIRHELTHHRHALSLQKMAAACSKGVSIILITPGAKRRRDSHVNKHLIMISIKTADVMHATKNCNTF
jgi:hypothetical protein